MPRITLTIEERQTKLETIAGYSVENLYVAGIRELRELAKGIIPNYTVYSKGELLKHILDATDGLRKAKELQQEQERIKAQEEVIKQREQALALSVAELSTPEEQERREVLRSNDKPENSSVRAQSVFDRLLKIVQTAMSVDDIKDAVYPIVVEQTTLETTYYAPKTIKSNKTDLKKALTDLLEDYRNTKLFPDLELAVEFFKRNYDKGLSHLTVAINAEYNLAVIDRIDNRVEIDPSALLVKAEEVLGNPEAYGWEHTAIAIALVTGRRAAEIFSTGNFALVDDKEDYLAFSGIAKGRQNREEKLQQVIEIPCLVNPERVLDGIRYLDEMEKRIDDPEVVNGRYATPLKRYLDKNWRLLSGLSEDCYKTFTFKSLRALYAEIAYKYFGGDQDKTLYFSRILGHDADNIATANSYKVWKLKA